MARRVKDKSDRARFARYWRNPNLDSTIHRVPITLTGTFNSTVAPSTGSFSLADVRSASDYTAFAALYKTHRIIGLEIEFVDMQPGSPVGAVIGTMHTGGQLPTLSASVVQDTLNSTTVIPYRSHYLHWIANSPFEKLFFDVGVGSLDDFGAFVLYSAGGTAVSNKWRYLARAVVEFKDRL